MKKVWYEKIAFKWPKKLHRIAWCCFVCYVLFSIGVLFVWGVNMDSDATDFPEDYLSEAGTSICSTRTTATGVELNVDISADDAFNLQGATDRADQNNENFDRYSNINIFAWIPDFNMLHEDVPESYRFVFSSLLSWITGTAIFPIFNAMIITFMLAFIYRAEHRRLVKLIHHKDKLIHTCVEDYKLDDQIFLICCWPGALIDILSSETTEEEKLKLKIVGGGIVENVLVAVSNFLL